MFKGYVLAKKLEHQMQENEVNTVIHSLEKLIELKPCIEKLKQFIHHTNAIPSIHLQVNDILENIEKIQTQPFILLQLQRLAETEKLSSDPIKHQQQFKEILADYDLQVSTASKLSIDPHFKMDRYNSAIAKYQQWLLDLLFLLYCFNFNKSALTTYFVESYVIFMHDIYQAHVTTKISLRDQASINGIVLAEIPRNTMVNVYGNTVNDYWLKVSVDLDGIETEGYVQAI